MTKTPAKAKTPLQTSGSAQRTLDTFFKKLPASANTKSGDNTPVNATPIKKMEAAVAKEASPQSDKENATAVAPQAMEMDTDVTEVHKTPVAASRFTLGFVYASHVFLIAERSNTFLDEPVQHQQETEGISAESGHEMKKAKLGAIYGCLLTDQ